MKTTGLYRIPGGSKKLKGKYIAIAKAIFKLHEKFLKFRLQHRLECSFTFSV